MTEMCLFPDKTVKPACTGSRHPELPGPPDLAAVPVDGKKTLCYHLFGVRMLIQAGVAELADARDLKSRGK